MTRTNFDNNSKIKKMHMINYLLLTLVKQNIMQWRLSFLPNSDTTFASNVVENLAFFGEREREDSFILCKAIKMINRLHKFPE